MLDQRILILGSAGQLGKEFVSACVQKNIEYFAPDESVSQVTNYDQIGQIVHQLNPRTIINCAAYNDVDQVQDNIEIANSVNRDAVGHLADLSKKGNIFLVHFSSDYVFDGTSGKFYSEENPTNPLSEYGRSKLAGEQLVYNKMEDYLVFRLSWVIGEGKSNFLYKFTQWTQEKNELNISNDEISIPTFTDDIVDFTLLSLERGLRGLYHLTSSGHTSRFGLAKAYCDLLGLHCKLIPVSKETFKTKAQRPAFSCLSNKKLSKELGCEIPSWEDGLKRYVVRLKEKAS